MHYVSVFKCLSLSPKMLFFQKCTSYQLKTVLKHKFILISKDIFKVTYLQNKFYLICTDFYCFTKTYAIKMI